MDEDTKKDFVFFMNKSDDPVWRRVIFSKGSMEKLVEFQDRLPEELRDRVVMVTVTLDPAFDTPEVLGEYAARYGARWRLVTTNARETRESTDCCGVAFREESPGVIAHTMNTMVIAPGGSVAEEFSGSGWTVEALLQSVRDALQSGPS